MISVVSLAESLTHNGTFSFLCKNFNQNHDIAELLCWNCPCFLKVFLFCWWFTYWVYFHYVCHKNDISFNRAEEELKVELKVEELNKEAEAEHNKRQQEATKKYEEAKKNLEAAGAEFVSREEFDKLKAKKTGGA